MEVVGCKAEADSCTLRPGPGAMLFHGISGDHIQGIMEEMERRSKSESRLAKGMQLNGRESVRGDDCGGGGVCVFAGIEGEKWLNLEFGVMGKKKHEKPSAKFLLPACGRFFFPRSCLYLNSCQPEQRVRAERFF